ncbi:hypothetical protein EDB89DRAFT_1642539 [Lactarius sanguifluus]|nr:hypothetical protein EDB89DRAFT_1642539 [Lactarius sanguifluus]
MASWQGRHSRTVCANKMRLPVQLRRKQKSSNAQPPPSLSAESTVLRRAGQCKGHERSCPWSFYEIDFNAEGPDGVQHGEMARELALSGAEKLVRLPYPQLYRSRTEAALARAHPFFPSHHPSDPESLTLALTAGSTNQNTSLSPTRHVLLAPEGPCPPARRRDLTLDT